MKSATYFVVLEIHYFEDGSIKINQKAYTKRVLQKICMKNCIPVYISMLKDNTIEEKREEQSSETFPYREDLMY